MIENRVAVAQGVFWSAAGLWPVLHLRSFEKVTGPKPEGWLVKTIGSLITVVGTTLLISARQRKISPEAKWLGIASAMTLGFADALYVGKRRIKPVYLLDVPIELAFIAGWIFAQPAPKRIGGRRER